MIEPWPARLWTRAKVPAGRSGGDSEANVSCRVRGHALAPPSAVGVVGRACACLLRGRRTGYVCNQHATWTFPTSKRIECAHNAHRYAALAFARGKPAWRTHHDSRSADDSPDHSSRYRRRDTAALGSRSYRVRGQSRRRGVATPLPARSPTRGHDPAAKSCGVLDRERRRTRRGAAGPLRRGRTHATGRLP